MSGLFTPFSGALSLSIYSSHFKSSQDDRSNVVYLITCKKCALQYVGSTIIMFRLRFSNHKSRIRNFRASREIG